MKIIYKKKVCENPTFRSVLADFWDWFFFRAIPGNSNFLQMICFSALGIIYIHIFFYSKLRYYVRSRNYLL